MVKTIIILFLALLVSCSGTPGNGSDISSTTDPENGNVSIDVGTSASSTKISDLITVSGGDRIIKLTGLKSGRLYTIYTGSADIRSSSAASVSMKTESSSITSLANDTYLVVAEAGQTEVEFPASSIGLQNGGSFRVGNVASDKISFQDGSKGMAIGQGVSPMAFVDENGYEHYEAFFRVDVSDIPNPENVVINEVLSHTGGSAEGSHSFCFVDETGKRIGTSALAVLDLSGYDTIYLWMQNIVYYSPNNDLVQTLYFVAPEIMNGIGTTLRNPGTYLIEASSSAQYLVVGKAKDSGGLGAFVNDINARYTDGSRFEGVVPVGMDEKSVYISIPAHSEPILFDYDGIDVPAHIERDNGRFTVGTIGDETKTFSVSEGTYVQAVRYTGQSTGSTVTFSSDAEDSRIKIFFSGPNGHGGRGCEQGEKIAIEGSHAIETFFFQNYNREACTYTVTIQ